MVRPWPCWLRMSMVPARARRRVATTSSPTPRPEISVTMSRVENPGSKVRRAISASVGMASASSSPRSTARLRMSRRSRPRPSSATCTVTTWPRRATVRVMVPAGGLPARARASGSSRPWSTALRRMCSKGSVNWFSTSASTRISWPTTTSCACLPVATAVWRTLRCRRGTMVSTGAMRVCEVRCASSRIRRRCWCTMPASPASSSLRPRPRSRASVDSSMSARVIDCTSLYWSISSESNCGRGGRHRVQLVARGHAADVDRVLELEQPLLDGAIALDQLARVDGRALQFLLELADLDGDLADHAHQVVEQLRGHARHGARFGARALPARPRRGSASAGASAAARGASSAALVVARRVEHLDDGERVVRRRRLHRPPRPPSVRGSRPRPSARGRDVRKARPRRLRRFPARPRGDARAWRRRGYRECWPNP